MLLYWFLPMILFLGIVTSYEDLRYGKIKNKWIMLALIYSIIINAVLLSLNYYDSRYLIRFLINGLLSLIIGFIIWYSNLWTAGDAKLFFAYSLLVPSTIFTKGNFQYFTFMDILINAFVPISFFYFISAIFKTSINTKIQHLKAAINPKIVSIVLLYAFGFSWALRMLFDFLKLETNNFLISIILIILYMTLSRLAEAKAAYIFLLTSILRLFLDSSAISYGSIKFLFLISISIVLFRYFVMNLGDEEFTKSVPIKSLKRGMLPAEIIFWHKKKFIKRKLIRQTFFSKYNRKIKGKSIFNVKPEGLTSREVKFIKNIKMPFKRLRVYQTSGFAIYLFMGVLITIILNGNILTFVANEIFS